MPSKKVSLSIHIKNVERSFDDVVYMMTNTKTVIIYLWKLQRRIVVRNLLLQVLNFSLYWCQVNEFDKDETSAKGMIVLSIFPLLSVMPVNPGIDAMISISFIFVLEISLHGIAILAIEIKIQSFTKKLLICWDMEIASQISHSISMINTKFAYEKRIFIVLLKQRGKLWNPWTMRM